MQSRAAVKHTFHFEGNRTKEMSHTVTVTRTTTTTTTSAIILNTGYLKTFPGILKFLEVIIGGIALALMSWYSTSYVTVSEQFFFCAITAVLLGSFCLLISCIFSVSTASIIAKTMFEFIYHLFAFCLITAASVTFLIDMNDRSQRSYNYKPFYAASVLGLICAVLYFLSTVFAFRSYKGRL